ncbi:hypothetical protein Q4F19_10855 [Sphingomonas sp. BIUV-7]|uniref:STAS/SEC14 domain-containing protein n=1 Tax=Sphingomonas natans TaxID=3063330 RepID=A0ABT8Y979_9SPHN|nr:hypothetical protein [Sphingomonas sp. BIUV-7]MDO6414880.1 hypothetical protein [Sphingomonas sp. BIUV-7]
MTTGTYALETNAAGNRIVATLSGFFGLGQVAAYAQEAERLIRRPSISFGGYRMVIDLTDCAVQSQEVIAAFSQHVAGVPRADRLAVVAGSPIIRQQIRRIIGRPEIAIFEHLPDAMAWLNGAVTERAG